MVGSLAGVGLAAGGGFAFAHVAGVSIPELGIDVSVPAQKAPALQRLVSVGTTDANAEPAVAPSLDPHPIPGEILSSDAPVPVAPSILRTQNGWLVSDGKTLVAVYAGASGGDASKGRVVVVRQDLLAGTQSVRVLDAGRTGPLTIASAPLGSSVETSGQAGTIGLRAAAGELFALDLGDGSLRSLRRTQLP